MIIILDNSDQDFICLLGLWYNLNKTRIEKSRPLSLPGNLAEKKKRDRAICQDVNLNGDQQRSIPAGLFDGGPSYRERAGKVKKRQASSLSLTIPHCRHPFLFQSPLLSIPASSSKSPLLLLCLFPCLSIPLSVPGKGIMFLPSQPKGQIKMCCTHSQSV